jgi:hypothetical protein
MLSHKNKMIHAYGEFNFTLEKLLCHDKQDRPHEYPHVTFPYLKSHYSIGLNVHYRKVKGLLCKIEKKFGQA